MFNRSGATQVAALDVSMAFGRGWHAEILHKLRSYRILGQIFSLTLSFVSYKQLQVVLDGKSSQEYPVSVGVPQDSILSPTLLLLYITDLPHDTVCNIGIMTLLSTLSVFRHLICGNN